MKVMPHKQLAKEMTEMLKDPGSIRRAKEFKKKLSKLSPEDLMSVLRKVNRG